MPHCSTTCASQATGLGSGLAARQHRKTADMAQDRAHCEQCNDLIEYLTALGQRRTPFDRCLNETAIEKELFATENETPNMDLLTCSSALTSSNAAARNATRQKVEPTAGNWSCTGRYNATLGLGPLADLFSVLQQKSISAPLASQVQSVNTNNFEQCAMACVNAGEHTKESKQVIAATSKSSLAPSDYGFQPNEVYFQRSQSMYKAEKLPNIGTAVFPSTNDQLVKTSSEQVYQEMEPINYETDYYSYNPSDINYLASFGLSTTSQPSIYSHDEWYSQVNENITKYSDNMVDVRVNYIPSEYSLNQTGAYY